MRVPKRVVDALPAGVRSLVEDFFAMEGPETLNPNYPMLASGTNALTVAEFLNHGSGPAANVHPVYPRKDEEAYSCGWWAFVSTRDIQAGDELLYNHGFWGVDLPYLQRGELL